MVELWEKEETWRTIKKSTDLMKQLGAGYKTQFTQAAYSECWVAWKLLNAGYKVKFHNKDDKCDLSIILDNSTKVKLEIKDSQDNKEQDAMGRGFSSWVFSRSQVEEEKFNFCILVRTSLKNDEPVAVYVFKREELGDTKPVSLSENSEKVYYIWFSKYFDELIKNKEWEKVTNKYSMRLNKNPKDFENRWNKILSGEVLEL